MLKLMYDALMKNGRVLVVDFKAWKFKKYCDKRKTKVVASYVNIDGINMVKFEVK